MSQPSYNDYWMEISNESQHQDLVDRPVRDWRIDAVKKFNSLNKKNDRNNQER